MKITKTTLSGLFIMLTMTTLSQAKEWRGIVPLHSTRADVERLLGPPNFHHDLYDFENERALISYSRGHCEAGWDVPPETVLNIMVSVGAKTTLADLQINKEKLLKEDNEEQPDIAYYYDDEEGVLITVYKATDEVIRVDYEPAARDMYLHCDSNSAEGSNRLRNCPPRFYVFLDCPKGLVEPGMPLTIGVSSKGGYPDFQPTYDWTVSAGTIIDGQVTSAITIDTSSLSLEAITVTVTLSGVPTDCPNIKDSCVVRFARSPRKTGKLISGNR